MPQRHRDPTLLAQSQEKQLQGDINDMVFYIEC